MSNKSINTLIVAATKICFIGATARRRLSVAMVGIITTVKARVLCIAPMPTAVPPRHPTTVMMMHIIPKRLNSDSLKKLLSEWSVFEIVVMINSFSKVLSIEALK